MERGEVVCRATRITVHFSREPFVTWDKKALIGISCRREKEGPRLTERTDDLRAHGSIQDSGGRPPSRASDSQW